MRGGRWAEPSWDALRWRARGGIIGGAWPGGAWPGGAIMQGGAWPGGTWPGGAIMRGGADCGGGPPGAQATRRCHLRWRACTQHTHPVRQVSDDGPGAVGGRGCGRGSLCADLQAAGPCLASLAAAAASVVAQAAVRPAACAPVQAAAASGAAQAAPPASSSAGAAAAHRRGCMPTMPCGGGLMPCCCGGMPCCGGGMPCCGGLIGGAPGGARRCALTRHHHRRLPGHALRRHALWRATGGAPCGGVPRQRASAAASACLASCQAEAVVLQVAAASSS